MLIISFVSVKIFAVYKNIVVDESTVSNVIYPAVPATGVTTTEAITIFGGSTGTSAGYFGECTTQNSTSTCNSCTVMDLTNYYRCAYRNVYCGLKIKISFMLDVVPAGATLKAQWGSGTTTTPITITTPSGPPFTANTQITASIDWADIYAKEGASCSTLNADSGFLKQLWIAVTPDASATSANGMTFDVKWHNLDASSDSGGAVTACPLLTDAGSDSFCYFKVSPGDKKVYVSELARGEVGPKNEANSQIKWQAIRIFRAPITNCSLKDQSCVPTFASIPLGATAQYEDLSVVDKTAKETTLGSSKMTNGFENETEYMFNAATVDESSIVTGFIDPAGLTVADHTATPGEVIGLLDDKHCFIATAAFGSGMAPQVELLRKFRNQFLLSNLWGRSFVRFYYKYSPPLAQFISEHEVLQSAVRFSLWPLIAFAYLATEVGGAMAVFIFAFGILVLFRFARFQVRA